MLTPPELLQRCEQQQRAMEHDVFQFPPPDWAAFQNRLGQWQGVDGMRSFIEQTIDEEKRKDSEL